MEVHGLDEVEKLGKAVAGKIVFYNRPMTAGGRSSYGSYGRTVDQRYRGAAVAARQGAVAVLVRSMTSLPDDDHPHTGMLKYETGVAMIPAAALSTHSANELSTLLKSDPKIKVNLKLSCAQHPEVSSFNVIGELTGRDLPHEFVLVGGHLDSWDLGTGAHDDGTGVVQSIEVVRALKALGLRPRRTVRVVLFMAEEFGGMGAEEYARQAKAKGEKHFAAIESDSGGFAPIGFGVSGTDQQVAAVKRFAPYLGLFHADSIEKGGGGTDIAPLRRRAPSPSAIDPSRRTTSISTIPPAIESTRSISRNCKAEPRPSRLLYICWPKRACKLVSTAGTSRQRARREMRVGAVRTLIRRNIVHWLSDLPPHFVWHLARVLSIRLGSFCPRWAIPEGEI